MSNTTNREASNSSDTPKREGPLDRTPVNHIDPRNSDKKSLFSAMKQKEETSSNEHNAQIRSKLPTFHNPLKRFMKSKSERETDSEVGNVNHCEIRPRVLEKIDEVANLGSASTLNEQDTAKSDTSDYRSEHHSADAARTRESYQDLASYFSEGDPDEPSTSATNTIVLSASTFDRDVERTELSENLQSTTMTTTTTTSTSFGSEITDTVSNSMNTEEVSDVDFTDTLQRGTIVAVAPAGLTFSAQLGNEIISVSETTESRMRDQRIGRDDPREFYNNSLRMVIRKPICPQNDEPSIY
ncbi:Uncharacterized protein DBV15_09112 [Temnothorax longispinosus]|uniref:Uncharacterized protein n=1 Tax=Temnothorax longispinosus TaxID=300112 RepID=A0A4S2KWB3_9HYME|nr:Uncharacterized protein DBV15_09112 [Temnothorax longispinosus]